jgi:hypothetical protein
MKDERQTANIKQQTQQQQGWGWRFLGPSEPNAQHLFIGAKLIYSILI